MCGLHQQASSLSGGLLPSRHTVLSFSGFLGPLTALTCWPWGAEGPQGCCIIQDVLDKGVGPSTGPHEGLFQVFFLHLSLRHTLAASCFGVWPQHTLGTSSLHIKQPGAEDDVISWELSRASWFSEEGAR